MKNPKELLVALVLILPCTAQPALFSERAPVRPICHSSQEYFPDTGAMRRIIRIWNNTLYWVRDHNAVADVFSVDLLTGFVTNLTRHPAQTDVQEIDVSFGGVAVLIRDRVTSKYAVNFFEPATSSYRRVYPPTGFWSEDLRGLSTDVVGTVAISFFDAFRNELVDCRSGVVGAWDCTNIYPIAPSFPALKTGVSVLIPGVFHNAMFYGSNDSLYKTDRNGTVPVFTAVGATFSLSDMNANHLLFGRSSGLYPDFQLHDLRTGSTKRVTRYSLENRVTELSVAHLPNRNGDVQVAFTNFEFTPRFVQKVLVTKSSTSSSYNLGAYRASDPTDQEIFGPAADREWVGYTSKKNGVRGVKVKRCLVP